MALVFYPSRRYWPAVRSSGFPGMTHGLPLSILEHQMDEEFQDELQHFFHQLHSSPPFQRQLSVQQNSDGEKRSEEGKKETEGTPDKYQVSLNMTGFSPDEISIKTVGNRLRVHAKHETRHADQTGHSCHYQELRREFVLPEGVDPQTVTSVLSKDGVLSIEAPRMAIEAAPAERTVPVQSAEAPAVENAAKDTDGAEGDDKMTE